MFNFLLKIIDRKKYQILKSQKKDERTQEIYFKKVIPKVKEIQTVLKNKSHISFLHSGHLGDIINSLPVIKEISKLKKCSLYIEINKKINDPRAITNHPGNDIFLSKNAVNKLIPLLSLIALAIIRIMPAISSINLNVNNIIISLYTVNQKCINHYSIRETN